MIFDSALTLFAVFVSQRFSGWARGAVACRIVVKLIRIKLRADAALLQRRLWMFAATGPINSMPRPAICSMFSFLIYPPSTTTWLELAPGSL